MIQAHQPRMITQIIHNIITLTLFSLFFFLLAKSFQMIETDASIVTALIICLAIVLVAKFIVIDFILGTILAGIFNYYPYTLQKMFFWVTLFTCICGGLLIGYKKVDLFTGYNNYFVIYLSFLIICLLALYSVYQVKNATIQLKMRTAIALSQQILTKIKEAELTFTEAMDSIENDIQLEKENKIIINTLLKKEFEKLGQSEREFDKYLSNLSPK
jgi:hypothetical protein